jgi:hypothetical protein
MGAATGLDRCCKCRAGKIRNELRVSQRRANEASGMVDDEMRRRMRLVVPHVRRAVRTGK